MYDCDHFIIHSIIPNYAQYEKNFFIFLYGVVFSISGFTQNISGITHSGQLTGQPPYPLFSYKELPNPTPINPIAWSEVKGINLSWGETHIRYKKEEPAPITKLRKKLELTAWRRAFPLNGLSGQTARYPVFPFQ